MTRQTKRRSMLWSLFLTILAGGLNAQENAVNPLWESVVECIVKYESWHGPEHYPYVHLVIVSVRANGFHPV